MENDPLDFVSKQTNERLLRLGEESPPTLLILESELASLSVLLAQNLAHAWLSGDEDILDLSVVEPSSDKWSVNEIQEKVINRSLLVPYARNIIVIESADAMELAASEKLLKTVEEPSTPTTFIFCVTEAKNLSTTLQGRANETIHIVPATPETRALSLQKAGIDPQVAKESIVLAGNQVRLAPLLAEDEALREAAREAFAVILSPADPFALAEKKVENLTLLAVALSEGRKGASDKLSPTSRPTLRILLRELLERYRQSVKERLPSLTRTADFTRATRILEAADEAEKQTALYSSPNLIVSAFMASLPQAAK